MYPTNWYWLADDARVYDSANQVITNDQDAGYGTWSAREAPTPWPRDDAGNQTNASMQAVLAPYSLFVDLAYYAADARWRRQVSGVKVTSFNPNAYFASDPVSRNTVASAYDYALANPSNVVNWKMSDGTFVPMDKNKITTLMNDMASYVQSCYTCENDIVTSITGGSITTRAQVDSAFAAISNVFP